MTASPFRIRWLAVLGSLVVIVVLNACGGGPAPTPVPATAAPAPTPDLYLLARPPEHMANVWWYWEQGSDSSGKKFHEFRELEMDFTIHNDPGDFSHDHGLYLMLCYGYISDVGFYFGLQTDVESDEGNRGKGLIFSRWETRDPANARVADAEERWGSSSGHEGDFTGVRRLHNWGAGDYRVRSLRTAPMPTASGSGCGSQTRPMIPRHGSDH